MEGILEKILAAINANTAAINAHGQLAGGVGGMTGIDPAARQPALTSPPAPAPVTTPTGTAIDSDAIMALIQPHIANDTIKTALGVAMRAAGVNNLPEAQPHQYPALFQAFQKVIADHTGGGLLGAAIGAAASII